MSFVMIVTGSGLVFGSGASIKCYTEVWINSDCDMKITVVKLWGFFPNLPNSFHSQ